MELFQFHFLDDVMMIDSITHLTISFQMFLHYAFLLCCLWALGSAESGGMIKIKDSELKDLRPETETVLAFFSKCAIYKKC